MSETTDFDQPGRPDPGDEATGTTAAVLPFPLKKIPLADPAPDLDALLSGGVKPGEWQAELPDENPDDEASDAAEGDPVDPPAAVYPPSIADWMSERDKARRPVFPDWVKLPDQRTAVRKWAVRHYSAMVGYHAWRLPCIYTPKLLAYAPRGAWRWSTTAGHWVFDHEGRGLRLAAVVAEDAGEYLKLSRQRDARVRLRGILASLAGVIGLVLALVFWVMAPSWLLLLAVATMTTTLGVAGAPADRPLIDRAKVTFRKRKLSSDIVTRAFAVAGLAGKDNGIAFPRPIGRDGDGWRVIVDMPYGKFYKDALNKRNALASGLDIAATQLFLDPDLTSERRVSMWIADRDPLAVPAGRSPLMGATRVDFWKPFPWGVDERGNPVMVSMVWLSLLVGAVPRQGKTFSARTIALAAALDPFVRLLVFDGKASPDWRKFTKVAHRIGFGIVPRNGIDPVEHLVSSLEELKADVEDRYHRLSELPLHICPEGKLTPQISRDKKLNMPLTLVVVDEVQEYLQHPVYGPVLLDLLVYLARVAPAVGVAVLLSTQKPDDTACPPKLRDQCQARFALRVGSWQVSDVVLGAGAYGEGLDASRLLKSHKGVGVLKGMTDDAGIVRNYLADGRDAEAILIRAAALREAEGTLTGDAAGEVTTTRSADAILDEVAAVLGRAEAKVWSETIADRLAVLNPAIYGEWAALKGRAKADQLANALKPYGITTGQVWGKTEDGKDANRRGIERQHIIDAITTRNKKRAEK